MQIFLKTIAGILVAPLMGLIGLAGYNIQPVQAPLQAPISQNLGASNLIDTPVALFATSLASPITATANTMTLVSGANGDGGTLASSTYSFILDEGQSDQEFVRADCTNTTCINMVRGLSMVDGLTTITSSAQPHRRGQSVKITDAPLLLVLTNILNGTNSFPNPLSYTNAVATTSFTNAQQIIDKGYADSLSFTAAGLINATTLARGIIQLTTSLQAASSTAIGSSGASLVLTSSIATSTYNPTGSLQVVVTGNNNKIDSNFIATSTLFATSSIYNSPIGGIGKNIQVITTLGTSSFAIPTGVTKIEATVVGGGGSGGNTTCNNPGSAGAGGGGAGGYSFGIYNVSATTSVQVYVGNTGQWSTFGTNGFFASSTPGGNASNASSNSTTGGPGGFGFGGNINIPGAPGSIGSVFGTTFNGIGGIGGSNPLGMGGANNAAGSNGSAGTGYGAGGGGTGCTNIGSGGNGGSGSQGVVIFQW